MVKQKTLSIVRLPPEDWKDERGNNIIGPLFELKAYDHQTKNLVTFKVSENMISGALEAIRSVVSGSAQFEEWHLVRPAT